MVGGSSSSSSSASDRWAPADTKLSTYKKILSIDDKYSGDTLLLSENTSLLNSDPYFMG